MASKYNKTKWVNDSTPVNAENLNKIEEGIYQNYIELNALKEETILVKQEQELLEKELSNLKTETKNTIVDVTNKTIGKVVEINYEDLKQKRNEGLLKEGQYYRIIDYITKTANPETRSAEHQFDVIVMATSNNTLSEEAYASIHNGDNYFAKSKLEAWKLWYCLDNDIERFDWADTKNGKGIIYRMIDEFDNDLWYDFKNIQFKRYKITATDYEVNAGMIGQYLGWRDSKNENYNKPYKVSLDYEDYIWCYTFPFYSSDSSNPLVQSRGMYFDTSLYQDVEGDGNVKPIHVRQIHVGQCLQDTPNYRSQQTLNNNVFITSDDTDEWIISNESHHNTIGCWNSKSGTEIGINTAGECFRNNILFGRACHNHFSSCFE